MPPNDTNSGAGPEATPGGTTMFTCSAPATKPGDRLPMYGMYTWGDAFTGRQAVAMATLCDLVAEARQRVLEDGGQSTYADAVATYLGLAVSRSANTLCSLAI